METNFFKPLNNPWVKKDFVSIVRKMKKYLDIMKMKTNPKLVRSSFNTLILMYSCKYIYQETDN